MRKKKIYVWLTSGDGFCLAVVLVGFCWTLAVSSKGQREQHVCMRQARKIVQGTWNSFLLKTIIEHWRKGKCPYCRKKRGKYIVQLASLKPQSNETNVKLWATFYFFRRRENLIGENVKNLKCLLPRDKVKQF